MLHEQNAKASIWLSFTLGCRAAPAVRGLFLCAGCVSLSRSTTHCTFGFPGNRQGYPEGRRSSRDGWAGEDLTSWHMPASALRG